MRTMLAVAVLLLMTSAAGAATLTETIDRTFDVRPGAGVVLTNVNGAITVASWDQPRVRVIATKEVDGDRDDAKDAMKELRVEMQARDGGVVITTHHPKQGDVSSIFDFLMGDHVNAQVRYQLTVPRSMNMDVTNTNGSIRLTNIDGALVLGTTNGKITVERCSGSIDASTTNGGIHAELVNVAKGKPLKLETTNGRIEVVVPSNFAGDVDAGTTNGRISTDLPITTSRMSRNSLRGTINGGGAPVRLRTTNGGIAIRTASGS